MPILLFNSGLHLIKHHVLANLKLIFVYSICTFLTYLITIGLLYVINILNLIVDKDNDILHFNMILILKLSAAMTASNVNVTTTAWRKFKNCRVYSILFLEGMYSDALSITLYR